MTKTKLQISLAAGLLLCSTTAYTQVAEFCPDSASRNMLHESLESALTEAAGPHNGGMGNDMWGVLVNRDGSVCAVAFTGEDRGDQWPGSRAIAAAKAFTANAFSLPGMALSTANLWEPSQPGNSLYGIELSNPVSTTAVYEGPSSDYGDVDDPLVGQKSGGVNVFGGGLALYNEDGVLLGAVGVSGDSSCADHNVAWRVRNSLGLDHVPAGVAPNNSDQIIYMGENTGGYGHPECGGTEKAVAQELPEVSESD